MKHLKNEQSNISGKNLISNLENLLKNLPAQKNNYNSTTDKQDFNNNNDGIQGLNEFEQLILDMIFIVNYNNHKGLNSFHLPLIKATKNRLNDILKQAQQTNITYWLRLIAYADKTTLARAYGDDDIKIAFSSDDYYMQEIMARYLSNTHLHINLPIFDLEKDSTAIQHNAYSLQRLQAIFSDKPNPITTTPCNLQYILFTEKQNPLGVNLYLPINPIDNQVNGYYLMLLITTALSELIRHYSPAISETTKQNKKNPLLEAAKQGFDNLIAKNTATDTIKTKFSGSFERKKTDEPKPATPAPLNLAFNCLELNCACFVHWQ